MAVISRSPSTVIDPSGKAWALSSENLTEGIPYFRLMQQKQSLGYMDKDYSAGKKVIQAFADNSEAYVLIEESPGSNSYCFVESAFYPSWHYDQKLNVYHLFFWVNGWSPKPEEYQDPQLPPCLFPELQLDIDRIDEDYVSGGDNLGLALPKKWVVRDLPPWEGGGVGPFNQNNFFIAPVTDAFLYRVEDDYSPTPSPIVENPVTDPAQNPGIELLPTISEPDYPIMRAYNEALYLFQNNLPMTTLQKSILSDYDETPNRLINLARTTRVLMYSTVRQLSLDVQTITNQRVKAGANLDLTNSEPKPKIVFLGTTPTPLMAAPQTSNKIMCHRQKLTSYLTDGRVFILGPLNYRYLGAGSSTLTTTEPVVDFMLHDPAQLLEAWLLGGILPEASDGQTPPWNPGLEFSFPVGFPSSLGEFLASPSSWSSF